MANVVCKLKQTHPYRMLYSNFLDRTPRFDRCAWLGEDERTNIIKTWFLIWFLLVFHHRLMLMQHTFEDVILINKRWMTRKKRKKPHWIIPPYTHDHDRISIPTPQIEMTSFITGNLSTIWYNSHSNPIVKIVCGVGSAHNMVIYFHPSLTKYVALKYVGVLWFKFWHTFDILEFQGRCVHLWRLLEFYVVKIWWNNSNV